MIPDVMLASPKPPAPERRIVVADLLSRGSRMPDCGSFLVDTTMVFTDVNADSATLRVLVPCAELPREMYSKTAGDAPVLRERNGYRLELTAVADAAGKHDTLWRADRIDAVPSPRPAIADRMCHDVWGPNCGVRKPVN